MGRIWDAFSTRWFALGIAVALFGIGFDIGRSPFRPILATPVWQAMFFAAAAGPVLFAWRPSPFTLRVMTTTLIVIPLSRGVAVGLADGGGNWIGASTTSIVSILAWQFHKHERPRWA